MSTTVVELRPCAGCGELLVVHEGQPRLKWCSERCRKAQYAGACADCGGPTNGTTPGRGLPERCAACARAFISANARWTRQTVTAAIQRFASEHGRAPRVEEWRTQGGEFWPASSTVQYIFGSWADAIEAAGFPRPRTGIHGYGRPGERLELCVEIRERYEAGESAYALARDYDCSQQGIKYRIAKAGGRMRSPEEAVALRSRRVAA